MRWKSHGRAPVEKHMNNTPMCVIVTGRPGSGKTTLAKALGQRLWTPVISRDELKSGYVNTFGVRHDQLPAQTGALVTNFFFDIVHQYLLNKVSIIVEAAFQHAEWETRLPRLKEVARLAIVLCNVDPERAAARHLARGLADPDRTFYHSDKRVAIFKETGVIAPPGSYIAPQFDLPTIIVSTEDVYSPSVEDIVQQIRSLTVQQNGALDSSV